MDKGIGKERVKMKSMRKIIIAVLILIIVGIIAYNALGGEWFARLFGEL